MADGTRAGTGRREWRRRARRPRGRGPARPCRSAGPGHRAPGSTRRGGGVDAVRLHVGESGRRRLQGEYVLLAVGGGEQDRWAAGPPAAPRDGGRQGGPEALGQQVLRGDPVRALLESFSPAAQRGGEEVRPRRDHPLRAQRRARDAQGGSHRTEMTSQHTPTPQQAHDGVVLRSGPRRSPIHDRRPHGLHVAGGSGGTCMRNGNERSDPHRPRQRLHGSGESRS